MFIPHHVPKKKPLKEKGTSIFNKNGGLLIQVFPSFLLGGLALYITLPKFNIAPEKLPKPNRKVGLKNHHFSGANC